MLSSRSYFFGLSILSSCLAALICPFNYEGKFYIVSAPTAKKDNKVVEAHNQIEGVPYLLADSLCQSLGLRLANITADELPGVSSTAVQCNVTQNLWFNYFESLPFQGCNAMDVSGVSLMSFESCVVPLPVVCQVELEPLETVSVYSTTTVVESVVTSTTELTVVTVTETSTSYFVTDIVVTVVQGTDTTTTISTTTTSCSTIVITRTNTQIVTPTCLYRCNDCPESSSNGCKNAKIENGVKRIYNNWQSCPNNLNGFFLVQNTNIQANETAEEGCEALGYQLANLTLPIINNNLASLMLSCNVSEATFNSYYGYTPYCAQIGLSGLALVVDEVNFGNCTTPQWMLCRAGPNVVTTETVPTGPFSTETLTIFSTQVAVSVVTVTFVESTTENEVVTEYQTSFFPVTTETTETTTTTTNTNMVVSTTSCNCHPASCTTVSVTTTVSSTCVRPRDLHH